MKSSDEHVRPGEIYSGFSTAKNKKQENTDHTWEVYWKVLSKSSTLLNIWLGLSLMVCI